MKQALLVIDVQNDYFTGGKLPLSNPDLALSKINQLETLFEERKLPIIYIQHLKQIKPADFFEEGTLGVELHPQLKVQSDSIIIEKSYPNSFYETNLLTTLKTLQVEQLVITGMMTHMCVDSTTRASKELGFNPILISDATATKDLIMYDEKVAAKNVQLSFLAALKNFADVLTTDDYVSMVK